MRYASIKYFDIANGPFVRISLFVQGCPIHCDGCFNQCTWSYNGGREFTEEIQHQLLKDLENPIIKGFSILGGDPFCQSEEDTELLVKFCREVYQLRPDIQIWAWTGRHIEDIVAQGGAWVDLLDCLDVLVDGPYEKDKRDLSLPYCGSSNQRVIDVVKSKWANKIILWKKDW